MKRLFQTEKPLLPQFPVISRPSVLIPVVAAGLILRGALAWALDAESLHEIVLVGMDLCILGTFWFLILRPLRGASVDEAALAAGVVRSSPDGIITANEVGIIESFNPPAERLYGYTAEEVVGQSLTMLIPEAYRARHTAALLDQGTMLPAGEIEVWGLRKDGGVFPAGVELTKIQRNGRDSFLCIVRDITERKKAQEALMRYQLLSENSHAIVLFVREDGRIEDANRAAVEAYGYDREWLTELHMDDLTAEGEVPCNFQRLCAMPNGEVLTRETVHRRGDGRTFPAEVSGSVMRMDGHQVVLAMVRDITVEKRRVATQALLHEIDHMILTRQPLSVILEHLCAQVVHIFGFPLVWVGVKEPNGRVSVGACAGKLCLLLDGGRVSWWEGAGATSTAIRLGTPQCGKVERQAGAEFGLRENLISRGLEYVLAVPLVAQNQTLGSLTIYDERAEVFDAETRGVLTGLADQMAISLVAAQDQVQIRLQTAALEAAANTVLITDASGVILWVNPAWTRLTGYAPDEVIGKTPSILKSGHHTEKFHARMWETILAGRTWRGEVYNRRKDGTVYIDEQTITPVKDSAGKITHFIAIKQDVTDRKQQEEQLRHLAMHDPLTNLPNRRTMKDQLEKVVAKAQRGHHGALLLLDLDNFKVVNDTMGHAAGDQLLVTLATMLQRTLRPADTLARLGGDEFAVLLEETDTDEAKSCAERLRMVVSDCRFQVLGQHFDLGISIGIAPVDGTLSPEGVMALADSALYAAKDQGKNRAVLYRSAGEKGQQLAEAGQWASRIKDALRDQRFVLFFQPVVRLSNDRIDHYEALIRMRDHDGGIIPPGAFLTAAERFGLMPQVDRWVVDRVVNVLQVNPDHRIFVNLSGSSLGDECLLGFVEERIAESGIRPGQLSFEITETAAVRDLDLVREWMSRLKALGCKFALDDFGIGFSSFAYLRALPADYVKIDGSFIRDLDRDATCRSLVQAMKTVAHTLGKQVIAEWVEREEVAEVLRELGVEHGQGYRWGHPAADTISRETTLAD